MIKHVTHESYAQEVKDHPGRVLIDFYTNTCPPCRMMAPLLEEIATDRGESLKIVKVDASEEAELAGEFNVRAVPTFVLLDHGTTKAQMVGAKSRKAFEQWLDAN